MQKIKGQGLPVLAIDLGGTKIIAAIISNQGQVMAREQCLTLADEGPQSVINRILSAIDHLLSLSRIDSSQLNSISIAAAGAINFEKGLVTSSPNLPGWYNIPLRDVVKEKYRVNTFLINDASAAALGEHHFGAGKGINNFIYLTLGTGIGGGIIINGKLYSGPCGSAGEIGHMTIDVNGPRCSCGNIGCLETLASGTAVAREAVRRIRQGEVSSLTEIVEGEIESITAEKVGAAAQDGDSLALEVILKAANYLGVGMVNLVNIFNPEMIIVGGGVAKMGDLLLDPAKQVVRERAFQLPAQAVSIVPAQLGDDAGVLGAAAFAFQQGLD
ncbi:MAG: ROK family protein [Dehalococcoidia bacterium]|nr:MAG: ROK family protein [Dehalococcoidia bacterium]